MDSQNGHDNGKPGGKVDFGILKVSSEGEILEGADSLARFFPDFDPDNVKINDLLAFFGDLEEKEGMFQSALDKTHIFGVVVKKAPASCFNVYFHDVTDTKKKLDSLKTNLTRLKSLESLSQTGYWEYDIKRDEYYLSEELIRLFGTKRSKDRYIFEDFKQYFQPKDYERIFELSRKAFKTGSPYSFEVEIIRKSGETRYVHAKTDVLKDEKGNPEKAMGIMTDVTKSKITENELRQNEMLLTKAEEIAHTGSYIRDLKTGSYRCSKGFFKTTGLDPHDFNSSYETMQSITHPEDSKRVDGLIEKSILAGAPFEFENRIIRPDGIIRHIRSKGSVINDDKGNPEKVFGTLLDITDYKQTENRLLDIQKSLRQAEMLAHIGSWTRDAGSFVYQCSEGFCDICGLDPDREFYSKKEMDATVHPDDRKYVKSELEKTRASGKGVEMEHRVLRPDGEVRFVRSRSTFIYDDNYKPIRELGTIVDITRDKEEAERLRDAELIAKIGHWEWDVASDTHIVSEGLLNIAGYRYAEELNRSNLMGKLFHPDDRPRVNGIVKSALITGEPYSYEARIIRPDGEIRYVRTDVTLVRDSSGSPIKHSGLVMDVTEEVIKERRRLELESKLRQQQKLESIGLLAGGVAHEINNPVNGIMNYGQLILDSENIDEDTRTFASEIVHESERVSGIVSNLLKFSRHGRKTRIPVEFKDILERTLSLVNMVFKKDNIKIITDIKDDLPKVKCNPQEIQQVLLNLITNSRDALNKKYAGEDGNKTVTISMDKMNKDGGDYLEVVVEDFGMGIDPEILDRLFDPFFTTKGPGEGTGLGLSISYGIIEEHGGALWVESEKGKYTRFHIELPLG